MATVQRESTNLADPSDCTAKVVSLENNWVKECVSILPPQEIKPTSFTLVDIHPGAKSTTVTDYNRITLNTLQQFSPGSPTFIFGV